MSADGFESMLAEAFPEAYERLALVVEDVEFSSIGSCLRCGVVPMDRDLHRQWHRDLTFGINFAQIISVEIAERVKDVIDEMDAGDLEALLKRRARATEETEPEREEEQCP